MAISFEVTNRPPPDVEVDVVAVAADALASAPADGAVLARLRFEGKPGQVLWLPAATADDVTQETFVKVWRGLPSYDGRAQFSTWLYTIARNTALNALRARRPQLSLSDAATFAEAELALGVADGPASGPEAADAAADSATESRAIAAAIAELPERQQQVVALFYLQDRSYDEVAEMLAIPLGTVKTLLHRARARLEQRLGGLRAAGDPT